jgi:hypothetical protein
MNSLSLAPSVPVVQSFLVVTSAATSQDLLHQEPLAARNKNTAFTPPRAMEAAMTGVT